MGKKGGSRHMKRLPAPSFWPIHVKKFKWATKPRPGAHKQARAIPLSIVLRDILGYVKTTGEAKMIIAKGAVKVDGKIRKDHKYPVGLMDVIEFPDAKTTFRMVPFPAKGLSLLRIPKDESGFKLCMINNKKSLSKGKIQLNLDDGRSIAIGQEAASTEPYTVKDTIQIGIPHQKILGHIKFTEGKYGLVVAGRNIGKHGKIIEIGKAAASKLATVTIQDIQGETFRTVSEYVYAIGDDKPVIKLPGE